MSKTKIEWCARPGTLPETWNPTTGCNKVSAGCKNCYAERQHARMMHMHPKKYTKPFSAGVEVHEDVLALPFKWNKPRTVFVNSMSDLFHKDVSFGFIDRVFIVMAMNPQHQFLILTKRQDLMMAYMAERDEESWWDYVRDDVWAFAHLLDQNKMPKHWAFDTSVDNEGLKDSDLFYDGAWPLPNVWLGTSCEDQATANERIPYLSQTPAAIRFLSCEPLLGPIDLSGGPLWNGNPGRINWVIAGGESGPRARPMHPDWARSIRDQCLAAGVPFFFKQWGAWLNYNDCPSVGVKQVPLSKAGVISSDGKFLWATQRDGIDNHCQVAMIGKHKSGRLLDGKEWNDFPHSHKPEPASF